MTSKACCTIPPISESDNYTPKGTHKTSFDMKIYFSGKEESKTGVLVISDIFGIGFKQTLQGADIIAESTNSLVLMPDFFHGKPMDLNNYPPDTQEKRNIIGAFFSGPAAPPKVVYAVNRLMPLVKERFLGVERWAVIGYCWGGKISTLVSGSGTVFSASAQCHPAMVYPDDATRLAVPSLTIATKDEDRAAIDEFEENIKSSKISEVRSKSAVHYWDGIHHGFMAARANLKDNNHQEYYRKGYTTLVNWLNEVL